MNYMWHLVWVGILLWCNVVQAASGIVITRQDGNETAQDVFQDGAYYRLEAGRLDFYANMNNMMCGLFNHDRQISLQSKCESIAKEMKAFIDSMMAGIPKQQLEMMRQMRSGQEGQRIVPEYTGNSTQAGYRTTCYQIGATRQVCISETLLSTIKEHFNYDKFEVLEDVFEKIQDFNNDSPEERAKAELAAKGYVMKDVDLAAAMPNPDMMKMMPEHVRKKMLLEMQQSGMQPQGDLVTQVEKKHVTIKIPPYKTVSSLRDFMQAGMSR